MAQNPCMPAELAYENIFLLHFEELLGETVACFSNITKCHKGFCLC
jgi:hypothetical protein